MSLQPLTPTHTAHLFGPLHRELMTLLRGLSPDDWLRPTLAGGWRVRDVAAHLLEVDLRHLSVARDGHILPPDRDIAGYRDLVGWINHLNATGVETSRRFSTRVLTDLLDVTGLWVAEMVEELPPDGPAAFGVAWAGERTSTHWMDTGREYTERWHHQAQLRDALGAPRLLARRWLEPLMHLSVRVLPVACTSLNVPVGASVTLDVEPVAPDTATLSWTVTREPDGWRPWLGSPDVAIEVEARAVPEVPRARVQLKADDVWRVFYNALDEDAARTRAVVAGDAMLAARVLTARSVMV